MTAFQEMTEFSLYFSGTTTAHSDLLQHSVTKKHDHPSQLGGKMPVCVVPSRLHKDFSIRNIIIKTGEWVLTLLDKNTFCNGINLFFEGPGVVRVILPSLPLLLCTPVWLVWLTGAYHVCQVNVPKKES